MIPVHSTCSLVAKVRDSLPVPDRPRTVTRGDYVASSFPLTYIRYLEKAGVAAPFAVSTSQGAGKESALQ